MQKGNNTGLNKGTKFPGVKSRGASELFLITNAITIARIWNREGSSSIALWPIKVGSTCWKTTVYLDYCFIAGSLLKEHSSIPKESQLKWCPHQHSASTHNTWLMTDHWTTIQRTAQKIFTTWSQSFLHSHMTTFLLLGKKSTFLAICTILQSHGLNCGCKSMATYSLCWRAKTTNKTNVVSA